MNMEKEIKHIAIIMDGNGRWAQQHGHERIYGHLKGVDSARDVVKGANALQIPYLTLYAFSTENWNRPTAEVNYLFELMAETFLKEIENLIRDNIRVVFSGRIDTLPEATKKVILDTIEKSAHCTGTTVNVAISYSGRAELADTAKQIARQVAEGKLNPEEIDEQTISQNLDHPEIPDVDLMIRTAGDQRISNFLLWQLAYAELFFTPVMWPDFRREHLKEIIEQFSHRERRFGKTGEQVRAH